jgi:peptide/nickel transport system substrate-binding protein/oligopeptide transport system substrate-binding protein
MVQEAPQSLDPLRCESVYESLPINQIFDTMVAYDPSLTVIPGVAETWTISKDNLEYTFTLRPEVRFHNGDVLTSKDVVYSICRQLCPKKAEMSLAFSYLMIIDGAPEFSQGKIEDVSGLEIIDDRTLTIRLSRPYPSFLEVMAMDNLAILPERMVREMGDEAFGRAPIGTGPFRLAGWDDERILLEANEDYFAGRPHLDAVQINFLRQGEADFGAARFARNQLDVLEPPTDSLVRLSQDDSVSLFRYQELSLSFLGLNTQLPPLDQPLVRRALAHALDRNAMVQDSPSIRREAVGILPPGVAGYSPELKAPDYDPQEARRLLAQAGYPGGQGLPPIPLHNASQSAAAARVLDRISEDLSAVGIRLEIIPVSWPELGELLENQTVGAFLLAWIADMTDPDAFLRSLFEPGGSGNYFGHLSEETERLLELGTQETNPVDRARIYRELERHILNEAPLIPLYHTVGVIAVRENVEGLNPTPLGVAKVDLEKVWFRPRGRAS